MLTELVIYCRHFCNTSQYPYKNQAVLLGNMDSVVRQFKIMKQLLILVIIVRCLEKAFQSILHFYAILGIQKTTIIN